MKFRLRQADFRQPNINVKGKEQMTENLPTAKPVAPTSVLNDEDKRALTMAVKTETTGVMNPVEYEQVKLIARDMFSSKALPNSFQNPFQVQMAIMCGREIGMTVMEALGDLYFVNGRIQIYGKATPAAIRRAGWKILPYKDEEGSCTATIKNIKTGEEISDTFTFEDALKSGFVKDARGQVKIGWREGANRKRKLRYGALSQIIHTYIPEVLGSITGIGEYSEDYMSASGKEKEFREQYGKERKLAKLKSLEGEYESH